MNLLGIVIIAIIAIVLAHWTLENILRVRHTTGHGCSESETQQELMDYVRGKLGQISCSIGKGANAASAAIRRIAPKGSNYYTDEHGSDLHSEMTDLSKFFEVQQSVPDTKELLREITETSGSCSGGVDAYGQCLPVTDSLRDAQQGGPLQFDYGSDGSATLLPDQWSYQDENVMNGGLFDGVRPFDNQSSDFTVYPSGDATKPEGLWTSSYPYTQSFGKW